MYFASPAVQEYLQVSAPAGRTLRFTDDPPDTSTYVPEGDKGEKEWRKSSSQRSTKVPHYNLRTKGLSKKAIKEHALLDQYGKHYHALVHASGQATVDYDRKDDDMWSGPGYHKSDLKDMILWALRMPIIFNIALTIQRCLISSSVGHNRKVEPKS